MKKVFVLAFVALGFSALITSCGNGRHNCPAYGSVDQEDDMTTLVAEANE